jgi:hypothetical protein
MPNPYHGRPDYTFWRRSVAGVDAADVDPVIDTPFLIGPEDKIATAGSCFAQHISRTLKRLGYRYLVTEPEPEAGGENYGVFPARFGNIYTVRQLLQTFERAYALFRPHDSVWKRSDGALVDPFRPQIQSAGFASEEALVADRKGHFACVRAMFEDCDVFIFTLGLTEAWVSTVDGAAFPVAPGVSGGEPGDGYAFHNMDVEEMIADLRTFLRKFRMVNPNARVILTVSPVPLIATYEPRHVLVSNTYSKAALRVVAEMAARQDPEVCYFPSYEMITGAHTHGRYFADDLRSVTDEGVAHVMGVFERHFLSRDAERAKPHEAAPKAAEPLSSGDQARFNELAEIVCDEDAIDP